METASHAIVKMKGHLALILSIVLSISTVYCVRHVPPTLCIGYEKTVQIVAHVCPPSEDQGEDVLIFKDSTNGAFYYMKKAYTRLMDCGAIISQGEKALWDRVWRAGAIQPCVRLHVWKLIHGVLLLGQILHSRIGKGDSTYATCGEEYEDGAICCSDALLPEHVGSLDLSLCDRIDYLINLKETMY